MKNNKVSNSLKDKDQSRHLKKYDKGTKSHAVGKEKVIEYEYEYEYEYDNDGNSSCEQQNITKKNGKIGQKVKVISEQKKKKDNAKAETKTINKGKCSICQNIPKHAVVIRCGHIFCGQCLKANLIKAKKCPICRQNISYSDADIINDLAEYATIATVSDRFFFARYPKTTLLSLLFCFVFLAINV